MTCIHFDPERFAALSVNRRQNKITPAPFDSQANEKFLGILSSVSVGPMARFHFTGQISHTSSSNESTDILGEEVVASQGTSPSSNEEIKTNMQQNIERKKDPDEKLLEEALEAANRERASGVGSSNKPDTKARGKSRLIKIRKENRRRGEEFDSALQQMLTERSANVAEKAMELAEWFSKEASNATPGGAQELMSNSVVQSALASAKTAFEISNSLLGK
jgi:hypothetical protein